MYVAIDSSNHMKITGMISGRHYVLDEFYREMEKIFRSNHINPPYHWSKISRKIKEKTKSEIVDLINNSNLKINVLSHKKPLNVSKKDYFHTRIPKALAECLEQWLKFKGGYLCIDVDDDYSISKFNTTTAFLENLITQIGFRLVGKYLKIMKGKYLKATLKQENGNILEILGRVTKLSESKGIQTIDIILGIVNEKNTKIGYNKLYFTKI